MEICLPKCLADSTGFVVSAKADAISLYHSSIVSDPKNLKCQGSRLKRGKLLQLRDFFCFIVSRGIFNQGYFCLKCGLGTHKECLGRLGFCGRTGETDAKPAILKSWSRRFHDICNPLFMARIFLNVRVTFSLGCNGKSTLSNKGKIKILKRQLLCEEAFTVQLITGSNMHKCSLSSSHCVCFSPCCRFWQTQVQGKTGTASLYVIIQAQCLRVHWTQYCRWLHKVTTYIYTYIHTSFCAFSKWFLTYTTEKRKQQIRGNGNIKQDVTQQGRKTLLVLFIRWRSQY